MHGSTPDSPADVPTGIAVGANNPSIPGALIGKNCFVRDLRPHDSVKTTFLVQSKSLLYAKNGRPYLAILLADKSGAIDGRVWQDAEHLHDRISEGGVVAVFGKTHSFQNRLQLVVDQLIEVSREEVTMEEYLPEPPEGIEEKFEQLLEAFRSLSCPWTRKLGLELLSDPEIARGFRLCPAAKTIHHAYLGGLLIHVLQLVRLVEAVAPLYPVVNKSILMFGAVFHDFGKIWELSYNGSFSYTDEGRLVGHIPIGASIVDRKIREIEGFPELLGFQLKHIILSHHGRLDYGSPKVPQTLEAVLLHALDDMDSRLESIESLMRSERSQSRWTSVHKAYGTAFFKPDGLLE